MTPIRRTAEKFLAVLASIAVLVLLGSCSAREPDGPAFNEPASKLQLKDWIDLVIEYKLGTIRISVNGHSKTYQHEKVTTLNPKDKLGPRFTWKGGPDCRIVFDSVQLWECGK